MGLLDRAGNGSEGMILSGDENERGLGNKAHTVPTQETTL